MARVKKNPRRRVPRVVYAYSQGGRPRVYYNPDNYPRAANRRYIGTVLGGRRAGAVLRWELGKRRISRRNTVTTHYGPLSPEDAAAFALIPEPEGVLWNPIVIRGGHRPIRPAGSSRANPIVIVD